MQHLTSLQQTIVALCTPQGSGAIGLIRLSGDDVFDIVKRCSKLASGASLDAVTTHTIHYGWVVDQNGKHLDQVLFLVMRGPKTFTGQNVVEITCHNNPFLIDVLLRRMLECGARLAGNGEFTQRAVMLGKIDLIQAEAINDLIHAQTAASLQYSLAQLEGSLSSWIGRIEQSVLEMMAFCEGSFEFLDEEMEFSDHIAVRLKDLIQHVEKLLASYPKQQYIKQGVRVALIGSVNAGKSSLFNCLLDKKRAIVTPVAGTTRDTIEAGVFKEQEFITFVDTAGIRQTDDVIEKEGIDRSLQEAAGSDLILLVLDSSWSLSEDVRSVYQKIIDQYRDKIILVHNKMDQKTTDNQLQYSGAQLSVSASEHKNIDQLYHIVFEKIQQLKGSHKIIGLLNQRQYELLARFLKDLQAIQSMVHVRRIDYELVSCRLKDALMLLSEMTGRSVSEAALDKVFQTFCVGK